MTDINQPPILAELRSMASSANGIDQQIFFRLMLATMADIYERNAEIYERIAKFEEHCHPDIDERLKSLDARDWRVIITTVITGLVAGVLAYFAPHK